MKLLYIYIIQINYYLNNYFFLYIYFTDKTVLRYEVKLVKENISLEQLQSEPLYFTRSQRGRPILWFLNFKFRKERHCTNGNEYWRCLQAKCKGRLTLKNSNIVKYHSHTIEHGTK